MDIPNAAPDIKNIPFSLLNPQKVKKDKCDPNYKKYTNNCPSSIPTLNPKRGTIISSVDMIKALK